MILIILKYSINEPLQGFVAGRISNSLAKNVWNSFNKHRVLEIQSSSQAVGSLTSDSPSFFLSMFAFIMKAKRGLAGGQFDHP